jgi:hypothetical protein
MEVELLFTSSDHEFYGQGVKREMLVLEIEEKRLSNLAKGCSL